MEDTYRPYNTCQLFAYKNSSLTIASTFFLYPFGERSLLTLAQSWTYLMYPEDQQPVCIQLLVSLYSLVFISPRVLKRFMYR